jgi:hypothetical protein
MTELQARDVPIDLKAFPMTAKTAHSEFPAAALAATDHGLSATGARVTLLEYGDCECPACIQAQPLLRALQSA